MATKNQEVVCVCDFPQCNLYLDNPIALPCGYTVCQQHVESFQESSTFKCILCDEDHIVPQNGFKTNYSIMKLINISYHLNGIHKDAQNSLRELYELVKEYNEIKPEEFVYDYFSNLRNKVDLHKELIVKRINEIHKELINDLIERENKCKLNLVNLKKENFDELDDGKLNNWQTELRNPDIDRSKIEDLLNKMNQNIKNIKYQNQKYKMALKMNQEVVYEYEHSGELSLCELEEFNLHVDLNNDFNDCFELTVYTNHKERVKSIKSLNDKTLLSASFDKSIKVWDLESDQCVKTLTDHQGWVTCLSILSNDRFASGSSDKSIKIWSSKTFECLNTIKENDNIYSLIFIGSRNELACGLLNGSISIWNIDQAKMTKSIKAHEKRIVCMILANDDKLISGSDDAKIKIWNINNNFELIKQLNDHKSTIIGLDLIVNPIINENKLSLVSASNDTIKLLDIESGQCIKTIEEIDKTRTITVISQNLILIDSDGQLIIYDIVGGKKIRSFDAHLSNIDQFEVMSNGIVFSCSKDSTIKSWQILNKHL